MIQTPDIQRPDPALSAGLQRIGAATAASELYLLGIRDPFIRGPRSCRQGKCVAGPALTLQFMPKREDRYGGDEYTDREKQLHRHAMYHTQRGDVLVVDARGDMRSGIFGEMMLTYFHGRGGAGIVLDGCLRDTPKIAELDLGLWTLGATPNFHTQTILMPFAVNVPIACGGTYVEPGDLIVADDDGAVVVPVSLAAQIIETGSHHAEWEDFTRLRLSEGGDLRRYYPLSAEAEDEYRAWRAKQDAAG